MLSRIDSSSSRDTGPPVDKVTPALDARIKRIRDAERVLQDDLGEVGELRIVEIQLVAVAPMREAGRLVPRLRNRIVAGIFLRVVVDVRPGQALLLYGARTVGGRDRRWPIDR